MPWYQHAGDQHPTGERYHTTAPALIDDKERPSFARTWLELTTP